MRKIPWSLVFVSASFLALAVLALLPQPEVVGTHEPAPADLITSLPPPPSDWRPVHTENVVATEESKSLQIRLLVQDQDGAPIPGVQISCDQLTAFSIGHIFDGQTDESGAFVSAELVAGSYELLLSHPDFLTTLPLELHLPEDADIVQHLQLNRGCVVEGNLLGVDGIPRNHGSVVLKRSNGEQVYELKPDAEGDFRFPAVGEGQWNISWYTNKQLQQDPRLSHTLHCRPGHSPMLQITIPTTDLRASGSGQTVDVGIRELPDRIHATRAAEL